MNLSVLDNVNADRNTEVELAVIYWSVKLTTGEIHREDALVCIFSGQENMNNFTLEIELT